MTDSSLYAHHISRIVAVLVYIEDHLDRELLLEDMAKIARISPFYFHRLFQAYMGETLAEHVKRLRLQRAAERLQFSDTAITDIALDSGYETPSSFTKVFNQVMGRSPRQYRKAMQPFVRAILHRTTPSSSKDTTWLKPEYISRKEEQVLFVRRVGDYAVTPGNAFLSLISFLHEQKVMHDQLKTYYSIPLDTPFVVERTKCRFDACVSLKIGVNPQGEIGIKTLPAGRFAVFTFQGPYSQLEDAFEDVFRFWYPTSADQLAEGILFCEHIRGWDKTIPDEMRLSKLYIPLI